MDICSVQKVYKKVIKVINLTNKKIFILYLIQKYRNILNNKNKPLYKSIIQDIMYKGFLFMKYNVVRILINHVPFIIYSLRNQSY